MSESSGVSRGQSLGSQVLLADAGRTTQPSSDRVTSDKATTGEVVNNLVKDSAQALQIKDPGARADALMVINGRITQMLTRNDVDLRSPAARTLVELRYNNSIELAKLSTPAKALPGQAPTTWAGVASTAKPYTVMMVDPRVETRSDDPAKTPAAAQIRQTLADAKVPAGQMPAVAAAALNYFNVLYASGFADKKVPPQVQAYLVGLGAVMSGKGDQTVTETAVTAEVNKVIASVLNGKASTVAIPDPAVRGALTLILDGLKQANAQINHPQVGTFIAALGKLLDSTAAAPENIVTPKPELPETTPASAVTAILNSSAAPATIAATARDWLRLAGVNPDNAVLQQITQAAGSGQKDNRLGGEVALAIINVGNNMDPNYVSTIQRSLSPEAKASLALIQEALKVAKPPVAPGSPLEAPALAVAALTGQLKF